MQIFDIGSSHADQFIWSDKPPVSYNGIIIPRAIFHTVEAGCGHMAMQQLVRGDYSIWLSSYMMHQRRRTHVRADYAAIEFSLIIENNITYDLFGSLSIDQRETQFNISYLTDIDSKVIFERGKPYTTLDIHCDILFMQKISVMFPHLINPLLDDMHANRYHKVFPKYVYATQAMMAQVKIILRMLSTEDYNDFVLDLTVQLLIASAMTYRMEMLKPKSNGNSEILDNMNKIASMLLKDLSSFPNIKKLAQIVPMNTTSFKKIFKKAHKYPPHEYWSKHRLEEAFDKVANSQMLIKEIGLELGFATPQSFSKEFKKQFHQPPSFYRKNKANFPD